MKKEIKFAESYIYIQKERFGNNFSINWSIDALAKSKYVVPMSLQLLIENAIKHNIVSKSKPLSIKITTKDDQLIVSNPIQSKSSKTFSTQLGLNNIERRYELISQKKPDINNNGITFSVALPLIQSNNSKQINENANY